MQNKMIPKQQQQQQQQRKFNKLESILFPISSDLVNKRSSTTHSNTATWRNQDERKVKAGRHYRRSYLNADPASTQFRYTPSIVVSDISYSSEENDQRSDDALFNAKPITTEGIPTTTIKAEKTTATANTTHMKDVTRLSPKIKAYEEVGSTFSDTTSYSSSPLTPHQFYPAQSSPPLSPKQLKQQQHDNNNNNNHNNSNSNSNSNSDSENDNDNDLSSMHKPLHYLINPPGLDHYNSIDGESLLLKKALKSPTALSPSKRRSFTVYNPKKRRESIGDITTKRRPVSTSVIPRLTKSSIISTNDNNRIRSSLRSISQMDKDMLASIDDNDSSEGRSVQWDPHIDAFEILRAKITGITRSMQEFHVKELFHDELNERKKKLSERHISSSNSRLLSAHSRRFSLATFRPIVSDVNTVVTPHVSQSLGHRRIKSYSFITSDNDNSNNTFHHQHHQLQQQQQDSIHQDSNSIKDNDIEPYHPTKEKDLTDLADYRINAWSQSEEDDVHHHQQLPQKEYINDFIVENGSSSSNNNNHINNYYNSNEYYSNNYDIDEEEDDDLLLSPSRSITSPNLTALFLTTNNLIHSRLDELSETASIASSNYNNNEEEHASSLEWRQNFLSLVTACIHQSEQLESLSTDVLNTEQRVRELMILNETVSEQFNEREKQYEERIRECQDVAQQQLLMIDSLEELTADVNMKIEQLNNENKKKNEHSDVDDDDENIDGDGRWDFKQSVADILNLQDKSDIVQKLRWDIGMFVGAGVGTGHVIHSFQGNLNSFDMMISGTGRTQRSEDDFLSDDDDGEYLYPEEDGLNRHLHQQGQQSRREISTISPTISHIKFYQHHYVLHITNKERRTRFALLPKCLWIPDNQTTQCQYQYRTVNSRKRGRQCQTQFTLFQRRHHCRRCGYIICQHHSSNKLPLFSSQNRYSNATWSRVCDNCFRYLIMK